MTAQPPLAVETGAPSLYTAYRRMHGDMGHSRQLAGLGPIAGACGAAMALVLVPQAAGAEVRLEAHYSISVTGLTVGESAWSAEIAADHYTATARSRMRGVARWLVRGEAAATVQGVIRDGRLMTTEFKSKADTEDEKSETRMTVEAGQAKDISDVSSETARDRVPVPEEHRRGIIDPISAMIIPAPPEGDALPRAACERTLPVFDGRRRYDLKLAFKRMDKVKAAAGYAGPAVVCTMKMLPLSGHRAGGLLVAYLTEGRDMELWLAPITGTQLLAPFRVSVGGMVTPITMQATKFEVTEIHEQVSAGSKAQ
jgi:Protein of unknown function (DUF3108)